LWPESKPSNRAFTGLWWDLKLGQQVPDSPCPHPENTRPSRSTSWSTPRRSDGLGDDGLGDAVAFVNFRLADKQALSPDFRGYGKALATNPLAQNMLLPVRSQ